MDNSLLMSVLHGLQTLMNNSKRCRIENLLRSQNSVIGNPFTNSITT